MQLGFSKIGPQKPKGVTPSCDPYCQSVVNFVMVSSISATIWCSLF